MIKRRQKIAALSQQIAALSNKRRQQIPALSNKRRQQIAARSNKQSSTPGKEYFNLIPVDLVISILSRLPVKCIARLRCVSKLWSSIIRGPNYNQLFPTKPPDTPRLLLVFNAGPRLFFISSPQPNNPYENSSLAVTLLHKVSDCPDFSQFCHPVHGLICRQHLQKICSGSAPENVVASITEAVVSNPITGESLILPKRRMERFMCEFIHGKVRYFFGYDPIHKQFKVLRITWCRSGRSPCEYHILTLVTGNRNLLWRYLHCCPTHYCQYGYDDDGICINGLLYYIATIEKTSIPIIVCFDVRSENFSFIYNIDPLDFTLIDYKGKLGVCKCCYKDCELWVLEDVEKHRWSNYKSQMPVMETRCKVLPAGINASGEIVLYPIFSKPRQPYFLFFYNLEANTIKSVRLEGPVFEEFGSKNRVYAFANYVKDVKLI